MTDIHLRITYFVLALQALGYCSIFAEGWQQSSKFQHYPAGKIRIPRSRSVSLLMKNEIDSETKSSKIGSESTVEEYRNVATQILSNFMQNDSMESSSDENNRATATIDFLAPKISPSTSLETLVAALDYELTEKEWFVTGNVNPSYFSEDFKFQDPDVKVESIEDYSRGVQKIFNQSTARAEIISTVVNEEVSSPDKPVITVTWRLSGGVNIGFGLDIKPYIVYTNFVVDPTTSLIVFQEDRFDNPSWDILLSALFPVLIGKVTKPPAPTVPSRNLAMPKIEFMGSELRKSTGLGGVLKSFFLGQP
mmetsp:Transcript_6079/g.17270  ORF Transcript_6079/g.17270 Transcript_6079/m.17270 type:complete len:307 (+) Transcript_6079:68-988(+)